MHVSGIFERIFETGASTPRWIVKSMYTNGGGTHTRRDTLGLQQQHRHNIALTALLAAYMSGGRREYTLDKTWAARCGKWQEQS